MSLDKKEISDLRSLIEIVVDRLLREKAASEAVLDAKRNLDTFLHRQLDPPK